MEPGHEVLQTLNRENLVDFSNLLRMSDAQGADSDETCLSTKDDMSPTFFRCLLTQDERQQRIALDHILQLLQESFYFGQCELVRAHLPRIVMMAAECPMASIRDAFSEFLELDANGIVIPERATSPSTFFVNPTLFVPVDTQDPTVKSIFESSFMNTGRVSHLTRILAWHPTYYSKYNQTLQFLMTGNGPLLEPLRHFIAILTAARWNNDYLVQQLETEFLLHQGDPSWLQGVQNAPKKIQNLVEVNSLLAHQPWLVKEDHIERLVRGEDAWSISELVHVFTIVATYRGIASFVSSMGITPEVDCSVNVSQRDDGEEDDGVSEAKSEIKNEGLSVGEEMIDVKKMVDKLRADSETSVENEREMTENEKFAHFKAAETADSGSVTDDQTVNCLRLVKYNADFLNLRYEDFDLHAPNYKSFTAQDFSWSIHGYSQIKQFYAAEAADMIDETFKCIRNLTYESFNNHQKVDTTPFRMAIWYYVHRLHGIFHDDYDYAQVNKWLVIPLKKFIKKMVSWPASITSADVKNIGVELTPQEKAHLALLVMEARKQVELMYSLRAIMNYHTHS